MALNKNSWKKTGIFLSFFCLLWSMVPSQERIVLEKKSRPSHTKTLNASRYYYIRTKDGTYYSKLNYLTDSSFAVIRKVPAVPDTVFTAPETAAGERISQVAMYRNDTIPILYRDIRSLSKTNRKWLEGFGWFGIGAAMGFGLLPVAAIEGSKEMNDWLQFEGILLGISVPPLFFGTRGMNFDLVNKWKYAGRIQE